MGFYIKKQKCQMMKLIKSNRLIILRKGSKRFNVEVPHDISIKDIMFIFEHIAETYPQWKEQIRLLFTLLSLNIKEFDIDNFVKEKEITNKEMYLFLESMATQEGFEFKTVDDMKNYFKNSKYINIDPKGEEKQMDKIINEVLLPGKKEVEEDKKVLNVVLNAKWNKDDEPED